MQVYALVPSDSTTGPITLKTYQGAYSTAGLFSIVPTPPPVLTGISPNSAPPGALIEITGSNLFSIVSVEFAGIQAQFDAFLPDSLSAWVPYAPSGPVTVTTAGGTAQSVQSFTVAS